MTIVARILVLAAAWAGLMVNGVGAAVTPIPLSGTAGPFTFDTAPTTANGWSTLTWSGPAGGVTDTYSLIDGKAQTNVASAIAANLGTAPGTRPAGIRPK